AGVPRKNRHWQRRGGCGLFSGERTRHLPSPDPARPAGPVRVGRILVAADRPEGADETALRALSPGTGHLAANSTSLQDQGTGGGQYPGGTGPDPLAAVPLAGVAVLGSNWRGVVLMRPWHRLVSPRVRGAR